MASRCCTATKGSTTLPPLLFSPLPGEFRPLGGRDRAGGAGQGRAVAVSQQTHPGGGPAPSPGDTGSSAVPRGPRLGRGAGSGASPGPGTMTKAPVPRGRPAADTGALSQRPRPRCPGRRRALPEPGGSGPCRTTRRSLSASDPGRASGRA